MGKKYIIELEDKPFHKDGDFLCRVKEFNSLVFDMTGIGMLTPYTEPDLEQVRKKAYQSEYETAKHECEDCTKPLDNGKAYQCGLNDAWEAARTLWNTPNRKEIFGYTVFSTALMSLTGQEAIEKIRQYEQEKKEKEEQIQVGDEVNAPFGKAIVVNVDSVAEKIWFLYADGHGGFDFFKNAPTKTGRHFPEIATALKKMRGEQDG